MKIKCPVCGYEYVDQAALANCLLDHGNLVSGSYAKLLFKIHEKIESLEKDKKYWDQPFAIDSSQIQLSIFHTLETLKSLLENK